MVVVGEGWKIPVPADAVKHSYIEFWSDPDFASTLHKRTSVLAVNENSTGYISWSLDLDLAAAPADVQITEVGK